MLAKLYATLDIISMPFNIDGISLNLKVPGRRPAIILNKNRPPTRRRFTLAHEIGHLVIPWHVGTIIDDIEIEHGSDSPFYWELEGEANRFAAELLMPSTWVEGILGQHDNPCEMLEDIRIGADVSFDAALIRLNNALPSGYIYSLVKDDGLVMSAGRSEGTLASRPERGTLLDFNTAFPASTARWAMALRGGICAWWYFPRETTLPDVDETRGWREVLDEILCDLDLDGDVIRTVRQTVNAIVAYANSTVSNKLRLEKRPKTAEAIYSASMQRFDSRGRDEPILYEVAAHRLFATYLTLRAKHLASNLTRK
jgi:hypothetical protein